MATPICLASLKNSIPLFSANSFKNLNYSAVVLFSSIKFDSSKYALTTGRNRSSSKINSFLFCKNFC